MLYINNYKNYLLFIYFIEHQIILTIEFTAYSTSRHYRQVMRMKFSDSGYSWLDASGAAQFLVRE